MDQLEKGSFRDRQGQVFYEGDEVFRGISEQALAEWKLLQSTSFFHRLVDEGKIVGTFEIEKSNPGWAAVLRHERVPFISYPYEWSFGMLQDAALLQLNLLLAALEEGMTMKDASSFNIQWRGVRPQFIDIPSFVRLKEGEVWTGYRQFCELFLYPLMLQAYKGVDFQPWLRGSIDGISAFRFKRLLSFASWFKPGVFFHVLLQSKFNEGLDSSQWNVREGLKQAGFNKSLIQSNARRLSKLVAKLKPAAMKTQWLDYAEKNSYSENDRQAKNNVVEEWLSTKKWTMVWDLGCNTGVYSKKAAFHAEYVVAMDSDPSVIERLYQSLKSEGEKRILPLIMNVADASPGLGWRGAERKALTERRRPELVLCLALVHHLVIGANIPLREFMSWLAETCSNVIIEFVSKSDRMVAQLLRNKDDQYNDYDLEHFETYLNELFEIKKRQPLSSGNRVLFFAKKRES